MAELGPYLLVASASSQLAGGLSQASALRHQARFSEGQASLQSRSGALQQRGAELDGARQSTSILEQMNRDISSAIASSYASGIHAGYGSAVHVQTSISEYAQRTAKDIRSRGRLQGLQSRAAAAGRSAELTGQAAALRGQAGASVLTGITGAGIAGYNAYDAFKK